ncbi:sel1 repeat family protein [Myroides sp. N17-2]|uniref:sel1 repeat family protein n=1 Tax=Myroides sp. N17-2 TaxID=2030799 RepID=UPI000EFC5EA5|nr:sel1 repeat family protein [Myroides sp. N17-2]
MTYIQYYLDSDVPKDEELLHLRVVRLINSCLRKQKLSKRYRINIHCLENVSTRELEIVGRVISILVPFKQGLTITEVLYMYLDIIDRLSVEFLIGVDVEKLDNNVRDNLFNVEFVYQQGKRNKRGLMYRIYYCFESLSILTVGIEMLDKNDNTLYKVQLLTCSCGVLVEDILIKNIHTVKWIDNDSIRIYRPTKVDYWEVSATGDVLYYDTRAESGDAHRQYVLAMMYKEGKGMLANNELYLYWLDKAVKQGFDRAIKERTANL